MRATARTMGFLALNLVAFAALGNQESCGSEPLGFSNDAGPEGFGDGSAFDASGASSSGGGNDSGGSSSGGNNDGGFQPDGGVLAPPTSILAVHASANLYDFRLCFGSGGVILPFPAYPDDPAHPMPETNYPGVPVGGAALLPALPISTAPLTPYVIRALTLERAGDIATNIEEATCDELICSGTSCLTAGSDYFALPPVTPSPGGTMVLAVQGCLAQVLASGSIAQCGATYDAAAGNLTALVGTLAGAADAGSWTMQLAQLSPSFAGGDAAALLYVDPTIDASVALRASASSFGAPVTVPLGEAGVTAAYFAVGGSFSESLASVQFFQAPASDPFTYFGAPVTYFVAVVGDATDAAAPASLPDGAANPAFDGHGVHVLAYPER